MSGAVVWFTGLPSSGKSTLAGWVAEALEARGVAHVVLDGDEVRAALVPTPGYSPLARTQFYLTLARLAALLAGQGLVVLVAATAHRRAFRAAARRLAPRFLEVFVDTRPDECRARNSKGLYGQAARLPGAGVRYEPPLEPDLRAVGGATRAAVAECLRLLRVGRARRAPSTGARRRPLVER
ncbi:MAG: adenylyl-sulfate kinase [Myxococcaceae bacterium]|nr:adenylyl-sulfate kinase [Myxococcaceae bacterium]